MPEILPNPFTDPKKLPKRSLFDVEKDEQQSFIDQAMAQGLKAAQESTKKKFTDPELQEIWDDIEEKIENGKIKIHEIVIGGKSKEQLIQEIETAGMEIDEMARQMMESLDFTIEEEKDLELIELSVADMGFSDAARTWEIYARIKKLGLEVVPPEAGPQLRLQYYEQPINQGLVIGIEPFSLDSGTLTLLNVRHDHNGKSLSVSLGEPDHLWGGHNRFIFLRK